MNCSKTIGLIKKKHPVINRCFAQNPKYDVVSSCRSSSARNHTFSPILNNRHSEKDYSRKGELYPTPVSFKLFSNPISVQ